VPVQSQALNGMDSLLSIVQMPAGVPVATFAIGKAGAINAALFATAMSITPRVTIPITTTMTIISDTGTGQAWRGTVMDGGPSIRTAWIL
jgi:phosphoribosylcarboxyaminoimidazole (NCAIR) mutase